jgi:glutathione S-transferase
MKLYDAAWAPSPRRVRIYLAEKGIEVERVPIDLRADEQLSDGYLKINPRGAVPALELDSGEVITESTAICRYFEAQHPEPSLFGATPIEIARICSWGAADRERRLYRRGLCVPQFDSCAEGSWRGRKMAADPANSGTGNARRGDVEGVRRRAGWPSRVKRVDRWRYLQLRRYHGIGNDRLRRPRQSRRPWLQQHRPLV